MLSLPLIPVNKEFSLDLYAQRVALGYNWLGIDMTMPMFGVLLMLPL